MKPLRVGYLCAVYLLLHFCPLAAETVRLRSGKEVEIIEFGLLCARGRTF